MIHPRADMLIDQKSKGWFHEFDAALGPMNIISSSIAKLELNSPGSIPNLRNEQTLIIGSDYSGSHSDSRFEVMSLLISNFENLGVWDRDRMALRARYLSDPRRMSYKTLNDGLRRKMLMPFLDIADQIPGLLLNLVIDKMLPSLFNRNGQERQNTSFFQGWKPSTIERAMRAVHFVSLLLRGLSRADQDVWWFTDQDEIVANEQRHHSFVSVMAAVGSHYLRHTLRHLRIATTASDSGRLDCEDFVAIPDFAAGALQEIMSDHPGILDAPSVLIPNSQSAKPKARKLMDWVSDNHQPLRRLTIAIDKGEKELRITPLRFHNINDDDAPVLVRL